MGTAKHLQRPSNDALVQGLRTYSMGAEIQNRRIRGGALSQKNVLYRETMTTCRKPRLS